MFKLKKEAVPVQQIEPILFKIESNPHIPIMPDFDDKKLINIRYPLISPYAYAHIHWSEEHKELIYEVEEPLLTKEESDILSFLSSGIKELINISFIGVKEGETVIRYLEKNINVLLSELNISISRDTYLRLMYYIYRDFIGLNEIEPFLSDYFIEDIVCNGTNSPIYIIHRKYRNLRSNILYGTEDKLSNLVEKLAQKSGKYISYASPLLDASLPDGSRVNAVYASDVTARGPSFTIRKFTKEPWTPIKLMELRTLSPEVLAFLWILTEYESNIMIIGGTASGKTTLLNALAFFIPPQSRIVSIEDTRELSLQHENWLPSVSRPGMGLANIVGERYGEISLFDLLRESFRQNPDYVVVGEVRGKEAFVLFQGAASGHPMFSTMHANSVSTLIRRLETPPIELSSSLVNSLDVVCTMIQTKVHNKEVRRLRDVVEIVDVKEGLDNFTTNTPFIWDPRTDGFYYKLQSNMFQKIQHRYGITKEYLEREFVIRTKLLIEMYKRRITGFKDVQDIISTYYKTPDKIIKLFNLI